MKYLVNIKQILESNFTHIDDILDKINQEGIDSLTDKEQWLLHNPDKTEYDYNVEHNIENDDYENDDNDEDNINWEFRNDLLELCNTNEV